jgi:7-carboxy-7-deazaguanine synthase
MALNVCELFVSLLGESTLAGLPAFFIRLAGCNLDCAYCDTAYAREPGRPWTREALVSAVLSQPRRCVLVTGGEPLLQEETPALLTALVDAGCRVLLETNGSLSIAAVDAGVHRIVDVKCPASGMAGRTHWANLEMLTDRDEVKFVVGDKKDFAYALAVVRDYDLLNRASVLISPAYGAVPPAQAAAWILAAGLDLRLNLQLHKYIWGPEVRGV